VRWGHGGGLWDAGFAIELSRVGLEAGLDRVCLAWDVLLCVRSSLTFDGPAELTWLTWLTWGVRFI
jgi:hypothetical protein